MFLALVLEAQATNVLVVIVDDLGADKVSGFTDPASPATYLPSTPTLTELQEAGISFTRAWANPSCSPTRAGLHTGQPAYIHGIGYPLRNGEDGLDDATWPTLGEGAQAAGIATAAFGKWHIGTLGSGAPTNWELNPGGASVNVSQAPHPGGAGFDTYVGDLDGIVYDFDEWTRVTWPGSGAGTNSDLDWVEDPVEDELVAEAQAWIAAQPGQWFAMVNFYAPHSEEAHGDYDAGEYDVNCPADPCVTAGTCADADGDGDTDDDVAMIVFRDMTECADGRLRTLLEGIDTTVLEDTVVVFMGDNGTREDVLEGEYADPGSRTENGKESVYETGVRVPLIVTDGEAWLDVVAGVAPSSDVYPNPGDTYTGATTTTDMHDTVLGWLDASERPYITRYSRDLSGAVAAGTIVGARRRCSAWTEIFDTPDPDDAAGACLSGNWKLVLDVEDAGTCVVQELYNLGTDPYERTDVAAANPATVATLQAMVDAMGVGWLPGAICP